jgi:hypothetical protein
MNGKRNRTRNEHRSLAILEAVGYQCVRSAGSPGEGDITGIGSTDVVLCQVKTRGRQTLPDVRELRGGSMEVGSYGITPKKRQFTRWRY